MLRIGWFSSGRGPGSQALFGSVAGAIARGELPVEIAYLFCNRAPGEHEPAGQLLDLAAAHAVPVITLSSSQFRRNAGGAIARKGQPLPPWRREYDAAVLDLVAPFGVKTAVLAGYMLIAPELCRRLDLLNLHPAAPGGPVGIWQDVVWQLIEQRAEESGVTIFRATEELDAGPVLSYCRYRLHDASIDPLWREFEQRDRAEPPVARNEALPLFQEIRRRGAAREIPLLIGTLQALADGAIGMHEGAVVDACNHPSSGLDLTQEVDRRITSDL